MVEVPSTLEWKTNLVSFSLAALLVNRGPYRYNQLMIDPSSVLNKTALLGVNYDNHKEFSTFLWGISLGFR